MLTPCTFMEKKKFYQTIFNFKLSFIYIKKEIDVQYYKKKKKDFTLTSSVAISHPLKVMLIYT